jgi:hypothetical protein
VRILIFIDRPVEVEELGLPLALLALAGGGRLAGKGVFLGKDKVWLFLGMEEDLVSRNDAGEQTKGLYPVSTHRLLSLSELLTDSRIVSIIVNRSSKRKNSLGIGTIGRWWLDEQVETQLDCSMQCVYT